MNNYIEVSPLGVAPARVFGAHRWLRLAAAIFATGLPRIRWFVPGEAWLAGHREAWTHEGSLGGRFVPGFDEIWLWADLPYRLIGELVFHEVIHARQDQVRPFRGDDDDRAQREATALELSRRYAASWSAHMNRSA